MGELAVWLSVVPRGLPCDDLLEKSAELAAACQLTQGVTMPHRVQLCPVRLLVLSALCCLLSIVAWVTGLVLAIWGMVQHINVYEQVACWLFILSVALTKQSLYLQSRYDILYSQVAQRFYQ